MTPTPSPLRHYRTSTEFTILGKKVASKFKMSAYKPGQSSEPLQYAVKSVLTILNREIKQTDANMSDLIRVKEPDFKLNNAERISFIDGDHTVGDIIPTHHSRNILILTTWRSGSTFLGDLLNHYTGTFYYFEPLHYFANSHETVKLNEDQFLDSLYKCKFDKRNFGYLEHVARWANTFLFKNHNFRLWSSCKTVLPLNSMCFLPEFLSFACKLHPIKMIKTVRMRMINLAQLLSDSELSLRVILLVRDPRAVFNSRGSGLVSDWCTGEECASPANECRDLLNDVQTGQELNTRFPGRVTLLRFEDLSLNPDLIVNKLLTFLRLPWTQRIEKFIMTHTVSDSEKKNQQRNDPYGTSRNSSAVAFAWKAMMPFSKIASIQSVCQKPMDILGYKTFRDSEDLKNSELPLFKAAHEIWQ